MKTFKEIKSDLLIKAKNNNACHKTYGSSSPRVFGFKNCIIEKNLSLIIDLDSSTIYKSDKWDVK